jgi:DNA repair protein RadC
MQVKLSTIEKIRLLNSEDIYHIMQRILLRENKIERNKEHFWIIGLAQNNRILYVELISIGTINQLPVEPMEVFSVALQKRTVKIILVHNHPSGNVRPSEEDKDITDRLIQVGKIINIKIIDHLIITEKTYYSFSDNELLDLLYQSTKYVPKYILQERLKKEGEEIGKTKRNKEIIQAMKQKKYSLEQIMELTGLSKEDIQKIKPIKPKP